MERLMSLNGYVRQLKPRTENYIPPVDKVQSFFVESSLSKAELEKPAGAGPNSGRLRIEIFVDKIKKGEEHILNDGETIVIKQITKTNSIVFVNCSKNIGSSNKTIIDSIFFLPPRMKNFIIRENLIITQFYKLYTSTYGFD